MTGETERSPSGWTTDTVKVLEDEKIQALHNLFASEIRRLEVIISGQERAVTLLGNANQIAQDKFESSVTARFTTVNEFRDALSDLGATMTTRRELESFQEEYRRAHQDLVEAVGDLRSRLDIGPATLTALQARVDTASGEKRGSQTTQANLLAYIAAAAIVAGVIGHYIH